MTTMLDALAIRRRLGRQEWAVPTPFGPDGWRFESKDRIDHPAGHTIPHHEILVTVSSPDLDLNGVEWIHASFAYADERDGIPTYDDLVLMHHAVFVDRYAYQHFVPASSHVNIHPRALHLWGRLDGQPAMPDFGKVLGRI